MPKPTVATVAADLADLRAAFTAAVPLRDRPVRCAWNSIDSLTRAPHLGRVNWLQIGSYVDTPTPRRMDLPAERRALAIPPENIRHAADLCVRGGHVFDGHYAVAGGDAAFDFELEYKQPGMVPILREYLATFRAAAPQIRVTFWGLNWLTWLGIPPWADGLTADQQRQLDREADELRPLLGACDHVTATCYLGEPESADAYLRAYDRIVDWTRRAYGRPVEVWIWGRYVFRPSPDAASYPDGDQRRNLPLTADDAARLYHFARRAGDATVLWGDWPGLEAAFGPMLPPPPSSAR